MNKRIIIYSLLFALAISLGVLNISCSTNANAEDDPKPANVSPANGSHDSYYTKEEVDALLDAHYQKTEVDTELAKYYQQTDIDTMLGQYYTQTNINTLISQYYQKDEVDTELENYYQKTEVDTELAKYYQKSEVDNLVGSNKTAILMGVTNPGAGADAYAMFHLEGNVNSGIVAPCDGILKNLYAFARNTAPNTWIVDICLTVNGIDTDLKLQYSVNDGTVIKYNTVDTVTVNEGDLISIHYDNIGSYSIPWIISSVLFDADL